MNPALSVSGHVRRAAVEFASQAGQVTAADLERTLGGRRTLGSNLATVVLCRMAREGLLERVGHGVYALGPRAQELADLMGPIVVSGALDRLEREYGPQLAAELQRRGWRRSEG